MKIEKIVLSEKFSQFQELWTPKIIAELNGQQIKIAKVKGEFVWHKHDNEDEVFLVVKGRLKIRLRDKETILNPGEMILIPRGVEHQTAADEETEIMMFEPATTLNTGDADDVRRLEKPEHI